MQAVKTVADCQDSYRLSRQLQTTRTVANLMSGIHCKPHKKLDNVRKVSDGFRKAPDTVMKVSDGVKKVSYGVRKM